MPHFVASYDRQAESFAVLLPANPANSALLKTLKMPFVVVEIGSGSLPFAGSALTKAAREALGRTVILITEKKKLAGKPWISRYGKAIAGEALEPILQEILCGLPASEGIIALANARGKWRVCAYRLGESVPEGAREAIEGSM